MKDLKNLLSEEEAIKILIGCKDFACMHCDFNKMSLCPDSPSDEVCHIQYLKQSGIIRKSAKEELLNAIDNFTMYSYDKDELKQLIQNFEDEIRSEVKQ